MKLIDINCDVAEGVNNEHLLMPYLSSCNIACAAHAGDIAIIDETISLAKKHHVKIGAHPSFPDREHFGRTVLKMTPEALQKSIEEQINLVKERASLHHINLNHVKAHGALYNLAAKDEITATTLIKAIKNIDEDLILYVPYNSIIEKVAKDNNISIKFEAFIDRNYNEDLTLVLRANTNALIINKDEAFKHMLRMINDEEVITLTNEIKPIKADTYCIHGDTNHAVDILKHIAQRLKNENIAIEKS